MASTMNLATDGDADELALSGVAAIDDVAAHPDTQTTIAAWTSFRISTH